jgi:flagellar biosynthesis chaperone FliJ
MSTKLNDYIEEVRAGCDEQRAHLDAVMRYYNRVGQQLALRLDDGITQRESASGACYEEDA